jgi:hypothetical protein
MRVTVFTGGRMAFQMKVSIFILSRWLKIQVFFRTIRCVDELLYPKNAGTTLLRNVGNC